ncbi:uncharacterized protein SPSK_05266 [Sporothrix schenckii 1099-18]|uniref:Uncharacterized protein n=1 Tax=Sporothrix schenckii 1099-18 TaxID=1397361 RepID=A0A0F2LS61_SPOSC|nr:uncharacterized protein SPSK_05266 [Sporothrix schenckii 1099-18]KJR80358.1 hypothetical protein SPSK_05266 [Sporothrix schenckii 1099-18]
MSVPTTPQHSRQSTRDFSPQLERRQSKSSYNEPSTPTHHLHPSFSHGDGLDVFSSGGMGGMSGSMGGLGNLADELGDAFSDGEDEEGEYYDDELDESQVRALDGIPPEISLSPTEQRAAEAAKQGDANAAPTAGAAAAAAANDQAQRDSGVDVASASSPRTSGPDGPRARNASLSLPSTHGGSAQGGSSRRGHKRVGSVYDGSEYGSDSDLESPGMPTSLVAKMDAVESLARRGTEDNGGPTDGVCKRLVDELRDLGSQSGVEGGASRLITAHSALTTHLTHQTRQLHALAFPLFSPLAGPMPAPLVGIAVTRNGGDSDDEEEAEDDLLPMLASLVDQMPRPSTAACQSLGTLHGLTNDLVSTLNYLSDTLHMARQTTNTATRRLRSAKELVAELRRDEELREEGERWLARGNWNERLKQRECAHVCGDVVGGFEEVCNGWRARLLAQAEAAQASA